MKSIKLSVCFCLCLILLCSYHILSQVLLPSRGTGNTISLNGLWKFKYIASSTIGSDSLFFDPKMDVSGWADIKTPGHWELQGFAEPTYGTVKEGTGLYRTSFTVPADWKNRPVYLAFDGIQYGYQVWVNGQYAGSFASSYNRQTFDITPFVKPGTRATLAVRVTTRSKGWQFDTNDCWALSGIIRDVTLFSLPPTHIKDLVVKTYVGKGSATVSISTLIENTSGGSPATGTAVTATLLDPAGKPVTEFSLNRNKTSTASDTVSFTQTVQVASARLWTAETPNLYTLILVLKGTGGELQRYTEKIGIREVSIVNGVLQLNGTPIKLRGVDHHDLSPVNGRSLTETEMLQDLKLVREANMNFIRTSHYPSTPRLIELCDSLGIYVMDEVPFGFGDQLLTDTSYLPILLDRARATLWRDKNRASVIIWSVGNENPITPIGLQTGAYVKQHDDTRPWCFPTVGGNFARIADTYPEAVNILTPHYPVPATLRNYATRFNRPLIATEYAHALGLDFDRMEELWEIMYANPKLAGGAVWHLFDQGILRKSPQKTIPGEFTTSVWLDSVTVYDNSGNSGADGLVYANRIPQVDYWQARKVYTPVKPMDDTFNVLPGRQTVHLKLINRYDFTNLSETRCKWTLYADNAILQTGSLPLTGAPHDTMAASINLNIPENPSATYYYLELQFTNKQNYQFYEKRYPLHIRNQQPDFRQSLALKISKPSSTANGIQFGNYTLDLNRQTGMLRLTDGSGSALIADGPYARMGRKTTMSEQATTARATADNNPVWKPHLLTTPGAKLESSAANSMVVHYNYERQNGKGQFVRGTVAYTVSDSGRIDIQYRLVPDSAKGIALEAGISFLVPATFTEFRWVGKGPYPGYPGKNRLNEFGFYHLNSADINYQGNHENVEVAVFSDASGKGFAIVADKANISVERSPQGLVVSHNAYVSGRFNKGTMPEVQVHLDNLKEISGTFSIIPLGTNWPDPLQRLFGPATKLVVPFTPFYNSYDQ